jgi:hypothetical protein
MKDNLKLMNFVIHTNIDFVLKGTWMVIPMVKGTKFSSYIYIYIYIYFELNEDFISFFAIAWQWICIVAHKLMYVNFVY